MQQKRTEWWKQTKMAINAYRERAKDYANLPPRQKQEVDAVNAALSELAETTEPAAVKMIELYYIQKSYSAQGAAYAVGYSERQFHRYSKKFVTMVAKKLGYIQATN